KLEPYFGFGADAHSFDGAKRWQNAESATEYVRGGVPIGQTEARLNEERLFLGLRLQEGIDASLPAPAGLDGFVQAGLVERAAGRLRLTEQGILLSNEVFAELIA